MNADDFMHALCIWREARGEGEAGMQAVSNVIRNRAARSGMSIYEEIIKPWQFSAITAKDDLMLTVYPDPEDAQWITAQRIVAIENLHDITEGATHYFNPKVVTPRWDFRKMTKLKSIGKHDFYLER